MDAGRVGAWNKPPAEGEHISVRKRGIRGRKSSFAILLIALKRRELFKMSGGLRNTT